MGLNVHWNQDETHVTLVFRVNELFHRHDEYAAVVPEPDLIDEKVLVLGKYTINLAHHARSMLWMFSHGFTRLHVRLEKQTRGFEWEELVQ